MALGSSLLEVEGLKKLMSESYVQILPQQSGDGSEDDGGYTRGVREMTRLGGGAAASPSPPGSPLAQPLLEKTGDDGYRRRPEGYLFPNWWFVCMAAPSILPGIFSTAFQSIVWPVAVANMAGFSDKAFVFAACGQVAMVMLAKIQTLTPWKVVKKIAIMLLSIHKIQITPLSANNAVH